MRYIGKEMRRVDGLAKVTGVAKFAAEFDLPNAAFAYILTSDIAKGSIAEMDTTAAGEAPGVIKVFSHQNVPEMMPIPEGDERPGGDEFYALRSNVILFNAQPIAMVVADTFEQARHASMLITVEYKIENPETDMTELLGKANETKPQQSAADRGDFDKAFAASPVKLEREYHIPIEHHNPMEPHAASAFWKDGKLTIFDKTQNVKQLQDRLAKLFKLKTPEVTVISLFVGGAFGSCLNVNYYPPLVALAAREVNRPVRIVYTRRQMFTGHGYRPETWQKIALSAENDGKLTGISHRVVVNRSSYEDYSEDFVKVSRLIYKCPNAKTLFENVVTDLPTPCAMRAPGAVSQMFALECAMDELAYKLDIDPLELRLINYSEKDPETGKPFSSKALRECYRIGSEKFGWSKRTMAPRSMKDGDLLVGWGHATGYWPAMQQPAAANITLKSDGTARVTSSTTDIGPGTYTVMTIIAAEHLGIDADKVKFELGDSTYPKAPSQGGSWTTASVGTAIYGAANAIKSKLFDIARNQKDSPLSEATSDDVEMKEGSLSLKSDPAKSFVIADLMKSARIDELSETFKAEPSEERENYSTGAHGAQFVEVKVDPTLGTVKVTRVVEVTACGQIINPKTSHSQEIGGVVWGIGMALEEQTKVDHRYGRMMNADLAEYHIPVHADIHSIETIFVEEEDKIVNPLGVKGMGELGLVGIPAAIANAVFHATGIRVRDLPISPEKLLRKQQA